ncbi:prolyl oligopeptidase [Chloropicon primus]|nr:prolyl oligopeptidase [Chloropicon primus]
MLSSWGRLAGGRRLLPFLSPRLVLARPPCQVVCWRALGSVGGIADAVRQSVGADPLRGWLRDRSNQVSHAERENAKASLFLRPTEGLQRRILEELEVCERQRTSQQPGYFEEVGGFSYYESKGEEEDDLPRICRRSRRTGSDQGEELVLLDLQDLVDLHGYVGLGAVKPSGSGKCAFLLELGQAKEEYAVFLHDGNKILASPVIERAVAAEWHGHDDRFLYYTKPNALGRPHQVLRRDLKTGLDDCLIHEEADGEFYLDIALTKDQQYLTITSLSRRSSSEVHLVGLTGGQGGGAGKLLLTPRREDGVEYFVEHNGGWFFILSNDRPGSDFHVFAARANEGFDRKSWVTLAASGDDFSITDMEPALRVLPLDGVERNASKNGRVPDTVPLQPPGVPFSFQSAVNNDFRAKVLKFSLSSPLMDSTHYAYDMANQVLEATHGGRHDLESPFEAELLSVTGRDGTRIPVTLVYSKDSPPSKESPLLMQVYAAYGINLEPEYDPSVHPLLRRGWASCLVHARGGGEKGRPWYHMGKGRAKMKSVEDFQDAYLHLVTHGLCCPDKVAAKVHSAGGLVAGFCINNPYPCKFKSVIANAPFVDLISVMSDPSLPHTVGEYGEFGDPNSDADLEVMAKICPYSNVRASQDYPAMLVRTSLEDTRVPFWSVAKWVEKIGRLNSGQRDRLLLLTDPEANHHGRGGYRGPLLEASLDNAFLIHTVEQEHTQQKI